MSILSLTFHTTQNALEKWTNYFSTELLRSATEDTVTSYIASEVETDMLQEGKNTNLLLTFPNSDLRNQFVLEKLEEIKDKILSSFGNEVIVFSTYLNPIKSSDL